MDLVRRIASADFCNHVVAIGDVDVVAGATNEDVVAGSTVEGVVAGGAGDAVVERVTGGGNMGAAQFQIFNVGLQGVAGQRSLDGIQALIRGFIGHIIGMIDVVYVVASAADEAVVTGATDQTIGAAVAVEGVVFGTANEGVVDVVVGVGLDDVGGCIAGQRQGSCGNGGEVFNAGSTGGKAKAVVAADFVCGTTAIADGVVTAHYIDVVAGAADHRIVAQTAFKGVVTHTGNDGVGQIVAHATEIAAAGVFEFFDVVRQQEVGERGFNGVGA